MIDIGVGLSLEKNPIAAAKEAAKLAKSRMQKGKVDLIIAVGSLSLSYLTLLKTISGSLPGAPIIGCSSPAIISSEGIFKDGLLLMALGFPADIYFNTALTKDIRAKNGLASGEELGGKLSHKIPNIPRALSLIFSNASAEENEKLIAGLQEKLGKSFPLIGAYLGDNTPSFRNYIYYNHEIVGDSCVGLLLGGRLNFGLGIRHGWKSLGKPHTATLTRGNIVEEIDGQPAIKFYQDYLGYDTNQLKNDLKLISVFYPLGVTVSNEEEYLLRSTLSIENDGSLRSQNNVPQGSKIRFMIGTKEACLEATKVAVEETKQIVSRPITEQIAEKKKDGISRFALVFSSFYRHRLLRDEVEKELAIIKEGLGEKTPFIGFSTYGELAPLKTVSYRGEMYSRSHTLTILTIEG